jgi:hypothetical protein
MRRLRSSASAPAMATPNAHQIVRLKKAITPESTAMTLISVSNAPNSNPGVVKAASVPTASVYAFGLTH